MAMDIEIRYFAAARAAAGVSVERVNPASLSTILTQVTANNPALAHVIDQCSFLVDSVSVMIWICLFMLAVLLMCCHVLLVASHQLLTLA